MKPGETLLLLGTGGVSIFALQFARLLGVRAIVTSKSDAKLERARELGAWATLNYAREPDWDRAVLDLTGGAGADATLEVGGAGTLERSIRATRVAGTIVLVGILTGGAIDPVAIMRKSLRLQGLYVGPRAVYLAMTRAVAAHGLRPVVDRRFPFAEAQDAFRALEAQDHFGKIVVER
jgi:NADPH:quinone reductase-like Zn-dependent oxidoreductase